MGSHENSDNNNTAYIAQVDNHILEKSVPADVFEDNSKISEIPEELNNTELITDQINTVTSQKVEDVSFDELNIRENKSPQEDLFENPIAQSSVGNILDEFYHHDTSAAPIQSAYSEELETDVQPGEEQELSQFDNVYSAENCELNHQENKIEYQGSYNETADLSSEHEDLTTEVSLENYPNEPSEISEGFITQVSNFSTEHVETPSQSADTIPVESFSYQTEESTETVPGTPQIEPLNDAYRLPVATDNQKAEYSPNNIHYDESLSTTVGVSEIMSDPVASEMRPGVHSYDNDDQPAQTSEFSSDMLEHENHTSYDGGSSYHDEVPPEDEEVEEVDQSVIAGEEAQTGVLESKQSETANDYEIGGEHMYTTENFGVTTRPTFQEIRVDLEKRNLVGHLHNRQQGQLMMHQQTTGIRHQDLVVMNPQTGEVLGTQQGAEPIRVADNGMDRTVKPNEVNTNNGQRSTSATENGTRNSNQTNTNGSVGLNRGVTGAGSNGISERVRMVNNMKDCQMSNLTVFLDRALVCRRIRPRFNAMEITEVVFEHLSPAIDKDSIRVEIRGAATILDVSYSARSLSDEEDTWTHTLSELNNELRQCQRQADGLTGRITRTTKQRMVLDTFADGLIRRDDDSTTVVNNTTSVPQTVSHAGNANAPTLINATPSVVGSNEQKGSLEMVNPYDPRNMDTLNRFLNVYEEQTERLDASLLDANEELEQVMARMDAIDKEIHDIELKQDEHLARELSVLVEPRETGQVEMLVSYVVGRCCWKPAYDIRIFNSDGTMKIVYYGMVQQATGEDWETRLLSLSTTMPGTGGMVPHLGLQRLHFKKDFPPTHLSKNVPTGPSGPLPIGHSSAQLAVPKARPTSRLSGFRKSPRPTTTSFQDAERVLAEMDRDTPTPMGTLQRGVSLESGHSPALRGSHVSGRSTSRRTANVSSVFNNPCPISPAIIASRIAAPQITNGATCVPPLSTTASPAAGTIAVVHLDVPRPPGLIRCDNEPVRVTVGLLDLQPKYEYVTVPKRSLHAYLKATTINRSDFYILAGQTNIYADNMFVGKSEIGPVAQGEQFSCDLGAENGVKVAYRPLYKYREGTGSGSKHATLTFKQSIELRNTFDRSIRLMVIDQVPVSGEDKIKVNLLDPVIKHPEKYDRNKPIRMNKCNNVEWELELGPGEVKELMLKYSVEHPVNEDLDVSVVEQ